MNVVFYVFRIMISRNNGPKEAHENKRSWPLYVRFLVLMLICHHLFMFPLGLHYDGGLDFFFKEIRCVLK